MFYALVMSFLYIRKSRSIHVHMEIYLPNCSINQFSKETIEFYGWDPFQDKKATEKSKSASTVCHMSLNVARINAQIQNSGGSRNLKISQTLQIRHQLLEPYVYLNTLWGKKGEQADLKMGYLQAITEIKPLSMCTEANVLAFAWVWSQYPHELRCLFVTRAEHILTHALAAAGSQSLPLSSRWTAQY